MVKLEKLSKEKNKVKNTREYEKKREIRMVSSRYFSKYYFDAY